MTIKKDVTFVSSESQEKEVRLKIILKEILTENYPNLSSQKTTDSRIYKNLKQNKPKEIYTLTPHN